jgi:hypothetical protein
MSEGGKTSSEGSLRSVIQLPNELTSLLPHPDTITICGTARKVDTTRAEFDEEEHIQCFQAHGFDGEEIARQDLVAIVFQKSAP